ncbi:MAG: peptide-binding protein [Campylobacterota bacterium]|nr:peptide-binding protein [Campylobacterota bacterium]
MRLYLLLFILTCKLFSSTLYLNISANPSRLNPILATDSGSSEIAGFIFSSLVKYDENGTKIIGDLASDFYFENNTTLIFNLKSNVKWHDGEAFKAQDVAFTFNLINDDSVVSPYTSTFRMVKSVEVINEYRLKVTYKEPYFKALETWMMGILPSHLLKDEKNIMSAPFNTAPIGTGPYKLTRLEHSKGIELTAYEHYFEGKPKIETLSFHVISDPMTRFLMLKSGELDVGSLEAMQLERQIDNEFFDRFQNIEQISHSYTYLGFNLRLEKFKDARVRRALSLAIDRQELVDILFLKHGQVCHGPFLPGGVAFNANVKSPKQNIKKAKALLKEAGYNEKNPFRFEIVTSNSSSIRPYAVQILQQQLSKVGVEVSLRIMEWQAFLNMVVFPRKFESVLLGWSLSLSPDPYLLWHSDNDKAGAFNFVGYHNDKVDSLIETMQTTIQRDKLGDIQQDIFKEIVEDNPYLFLYIPNSITAVDKKIKNIRPTINGIWHNQIEWEKITDIKKISL